MHLATVALVLVLLATPFAAEAQRAGKVPRIGFLANVRSPGTEAFQKGLREPGCGGTPAHTWYCRGP